MLYIRKCHSVSAQDLQVSDVCANANGETVRLISKEWSEEKQPVYNFEVEECHTYFVGATDKESVLVHNDCGNPGCGHFLCGIERGVKDGLGSVPGLPNHDDILSGINDIGTLWSNSRNVGHGRIQSAYVAGGTFVANTVGVTGVTTFYDPTDPITGERLSTLNCTLQTIAGGIDLIAVGYTGSNRLSSVVKIPGYRRVKPELAPRPGVWNTGDDVLDETVVAIEKAFPGKVYDVNVKVKRPNGDDWTDFDILLDDAVIQVKGGQNAKKIIDQVTTSSPDALEHLGAGDYRVFGYAPQQKPGWVDVQRFNHSASVTNNLDELLKWIGGR